MKPLLSPPIPSQCVCTPARMSLRARFGLFWKENKQNGNDQNYWNMKQEKNKNRSFQKWTEKLAADFSLGLVGEFKLASGALLF